MPNPFSRGLRRIACAAGALTCAATLALPAAAFDLQGHRGTRGLAPENTLAAFDAALAVGVSTLELDVHVTKDGEVVIAHDPRLNPSFTRDAAGRWLEEPTPAIIELTLAELQRFDVGRARPDARYRQQWPEQRPADGERVPTLAALFAAVKARGADHVRFNIETKLTPTTPTLTPPPEAFARALLRVVDAAGMSDRVAIQSFDWRTLQWVRQLAPAMPVTALTARQRWLDNIGDGRWTAGLGPAAHGGSVPRMVKAIGASTWSPYFGDLDEAQLREARALGLKVVPWTVNDPAVMERMLDWQVDGLITDYPDKARAVMSRRGVPLPPALAAAR